MTQNPEIKPDSKNKVSEAEVVNIIIGMKKFMDNTNEMIAGLKLRLDNQQIDIDKLKKDKKILIT